MKPHVPSVLPFVPSRATCWFLKNADAMLAVEKATGLIRGCTWRRTGLDLFRQTRGGIPGYIGGLRIYDERDDRWYDDWRTPFTVTRAVKHGQGVTVIRQYQGAPFTVTLSLRMDESALHWEVAAEKKNRRVADRSLRVHFMFPLIAGWDVWAPCKWGQQTFDGMTPFEFMYTQIPYVSEQEVILPMVSHFNRQLDVGYSMVEPIDANVPAAKFGFNNMERCYNWGSMAKDAKAAPVLEAVNYYIGLVGDRPMQTKVMLFFHEGDWRPGLGKVYRRWQPFFDPFNRAIYDREGTFLCGTAYVDEHVDKLVACGLKTFEVHGHFQDYGDYYQDGKDRWIRSKEPLWQALRRKAVEEGRKAEEVTPEAMEEYIATHTPEECMAMCGYKPGEGADAFRAGWFHERTDLKRRLATLKSKGISNHWYFNYTDGYRPLVEKRWPDSIARNEDGTPMPSGWYMSHNMNADPRWSFGKFTIESARKIFDDYGDLLDGFFLDCFRHYEIDFAHDDGVTVVNGKPAYSMNHSYDEIERIIKTTIMRPRNLTSFANKPMSIRSMRYCDGQLLEGDGDLYEEKFFWTSIAAPLFYLWANNCGMSMDECLRRCVLHACFPTCSYKPTDAEGVLYQKYLPLFAQFRERVLCFEPDPLRPPKGSLGKLYTVADGYVAGIINKHVDAGDTIRYAKTPYALFRVNQGQNVGRVAVMLPGETALRATPFKFDGTFIAVPLPDYTNCAVVKLFVTGKSRKAIGPDRFYQRDRMCGDPESAFEDISER
jgi:hypothetical protein